MMLPEIVAIGVYNTQQAVRNRETTKHRKTTMFELEISLGDGGISHVNDTAAPIVPDLLICAKPGQIRWTQLPFRCRYVHLIVREGELYDRLMKLPDYIQPEDPARFGELFEKLCFYYETGVEQDQLMLQSLILELIYRLEQIAGSREHRGRVQKNNNEAIDKVIRYIKENITADLGLEAMAALASFSPIHFHNCFKASTGKTLREYVEEQRIRKAINLLLGTDQTLSEIAYACGFSSQSYFSYAFRKAMGMTPRAYARKMFSRYGDDDPMTE